MKRFDVYAERPGVPSHWPIQAKRWGEQILSDGKATHLLQPGGRLTAELDDAQALDWWLPLPRLQLLAGGGGQWREFPREQICGQLSVILAWPDGTLHLADPPRKLYDLLTFYRFQRICMEYEHEQSMRLAMAALPSGGQPLN